MKKEKLKKVFAAVLATVMAAGAFAGCSGGKDKSGDGKIHISVSPWPAKEGKELDIANAGKEKFEKANPDVEVTGDSWQFDIQSFYPKAEAGMLPTTFSLALTEIKKISDGGYYRDWTNVLKKYKMYDKFSDTVMSLVKNSDGEMVGWPWDVYTLGLAVNIDMFEKAGLMEADGTPKQPKSWDELAEFAVKIKEATGKSGFSLPTSNNSGGWIFTNIAWSYGTSFMKKTSDGKWKATFDSDECAAALQFVKDLKWKYNVLPESTITTNNEINQNLAVGNTAMAIAASLINASVAQYGMDPNSLGMVAIPAGPKRHVALMGGSVFVVSNNATDDQMDAVVRYYKRNYNPEANDELKENTTIQLKRRVENNQLVGMYRMSLWKDNTENTKMQRELIDQYCNVNKNHVRLYNEALSDTSIEVQSEEPACAQDLYGILDNCIQQVLTDKDADCKAILKKANSDFQTNFLDNITY